MTTIRLALHDSGAHDDAPVLVLGHSLGTSAALWHEAADALKPDFRVIRWDLPGHGASPVAHAPFRMEDLTEALLHELSDLGVDGFDYAGSSIGGCVGLDLALRHPGRVRTATVVSTGARVDSPEFWTGRAAQVRIEGTDVLVEPSRGRWFAPSTSADTVESILELLRQTDDESYAQGAEALAEFDVLEQLPQMTVPILAMSGEFDSAVPVERSRDVAEGVARGALSVIGGAAHTVPAEQPRATAAAIVEFARRSS